MIKKEVHKKDCELPRILAKVEEIQEIRKDFARLFKRIEPFGGRKRGRPANLIIEDVIADAFCLNAESLSKANIVYKISDSQHVVTIDESELSQIMLNLIQNSIYWLNTISLEKRIEVNVVDETDGLSIIFSDNGPGINDEIKEHIFEPYFSTKPDGVGLGLAIIGEIMAEYDGELALIESVLGGASFKLKFRNRV